ncbi:MAG: helicase SNF2, partial [Faecousia sp.]
MGGADEQPESPGRGSDSDGADLRLTDEPPIRGEQFSFFPTEAQQIAYIAEAESAEIAPSAFSMPQEYIDQFLRYGSNTENHRTRIAIEYAKQQPMDDLVDFLEKTYHGGYGLQFGTTKVCAWYAEDGMHLAYGSTARYARNAQILSWENVAVRIGELLEQGQFATNVELAECGTFEKRQLAEQLWYMSHDMSEKAIEAGHMSIVRSLRGGFPEETEKLMVFLSEPESYQAIMRQVYAFRDACNADKGMMRFQMYHPNKLIRPLEEYTLPRREYVSEMAELPAAKGFITEDEINEHLIGGSNFSGSKSRIYAFYQTPHTAKEKLDFLKNEYGIGGGNNALSHNFMSHVWTDGKGIRYDKPNCTRIEVPWAKVVKYYDAMMESGRFAPLEELEQRNDSNAVIDSEIVEEVPEIPTSEPTPVAEEKEPSEWEYNSIKSAHPEDIVLYQVGDFFEIYGEDAKQAAPVLDLNLGTRPIPTGGRVDMCGIPSHQLEQYTEKLRNQFDVT